MQLLMSRHNHKSQHGIKSRRKYIIRNNRLVHLNKNLFNFIEITDVFVVVNQKQRTPTEGGWLSTFDLPVLTSLDQLIFYEILFYIFFTKYATYMRRGTCTEPFPSVSIPRREY
jgi:hypothetical protein